MNIRIGLAVLEGNVSFYRHLSSEITYLSMTIRKTISVLSIAGAAGALALVAGESSAQDAEKVNFEKQIWPLIENSCVKCHKPAYEDERGRMRKPKGDLVMSTKEGLMKGGEYAADGTGKKNIVPGKPEESAFLQSTLLPLDDDMHMPPEEKADQWTAEQQKLVEQWIKEGADFGDWTETDVTDAK